MLIEWAVFTSEGLVPAAVPSVVVDFFLGRPLFFPFLGELLGSVGGGDRCGGELLAMERVIRLDIKTKQLK